MVSEATLRKRDVVAFTRGDCHVLARELQRRTGWPIFALRDGSGPAPNYHAFVVMPDGRTLDVLGVRPVSEVVEWARAFPGGKPVCGAVRTDWPTLRRSWGATVLSTYAPKRARRVAAELLAGMV